MKVLVTGGAGFIGSNLVDNYINLGYEVVVVDNLSTGKISFLNPKAKFYEEDITTKTFLEIVKQEKPDIINHHAAQIDVQTSIKDPNFDAQVNILGTLNVLEACRKQEEGIKLIYPSSAAVYGVPDYLGVDEEHPVKPISTYGISKHTPEHYIEAYHQLYGISYMVLRYANVYGKRQDPKGEGGVISILVDCALNNGTFTVFGNGEQTRDFIYISDIVAANMFATEKCVNTIVNISTNQATSLNDTIIEFEEVIGCQLNKRYGEERKGDINHSYLTNEKAKNVLGWSPSVSLKDGLLETYKYYQN